jgi:hypothetical protein
MKQPVIVVLRLRSHNEEKNDVGIMRLSERENNLMLIREKFDQSSCDICTTLYYDNYRGIESKITFFSTAKIHYKGLMQM